jgi:hypothetical protein
MGALGVIAPRRLIKQDGLVIVWGWATHQFVIGDREQRDSRIAWTNGDPSPVVFSVPDSGRESCTRLDRHG